MMESIESVGHRKPFKVLPTCVVPNNYEITLKPNLNEFTFSGSESVSVEVIEETKQIVLNALQIHIKSASFTQNGKTMNAEKIEISDEEELVSFEFSQPLSIGSGKLKLEFTGILNDKLKGFYRSKCIGTDSHEERYASVTHFEPTDARRAFPGWDEPALKATFDITLIVPKDRTALSNMNVLSETDDKEDPQNCKEVRFATTPVMSTYLVAFIVGDFDFVEQISCDGVNVRVYTPVGKREQGLFALEVSVKALPFYKEYFNIAYPLPKIDLIAISDFLIGAMENWGLITYRETCLLFDEQNTSANSKQYIAIVVTHELAHQWFGNLVTMKWWTDLWLKEGFASFMEYLCVDYLFSEYSIWTQFVAHEYTVALELDALHNSHPIEVLVSHPSEVDEIFDIISYNKGASVIRMLHKYIGDEFFRKGLNLYLTQHSYRNSSTEDLWSALEEVSDKPVKSVMSTWTKQKGFPVISVTSRNDGNTQILTLTQEKFYADGKIPLSDSSILWMIPISISTASAPDRTAIEALMDGKSLDLVVPNVAKGEWIKLNPNTVGFYRTQYSSEMLSLLMPAVSDKTLPPLDRLGLQNDLFALVMSGRSSTVDVLKLMEAFSNEDDYTVWNSIDGCLEKLNTLLSHTELQPLLHKYGRQLLAKTYNRLGWKAIEGEKHLDTLLRSLVINSLARFEDPGVITQAKKLFEEHINGINVIPADIRAAVYNAIAIDCDHKTFESLFDLYCEVDLQEEKNRISRSLGAVNDPTLIAKVLEFSMSKEVRNQDTVYVIMSVAMTRTGRDLAWDFFKQNKEELRRRYEGGLLGSKLVKYVSQNFASEERAQEVELFFSQNEFAGTERTVQQSLEKIRLNANWLARDHNSIQTYLSNSF